MRSQLIEKLLLGTSQPGRMSLDYAPAGFGKNVAAERVCLPNVNERRRGFSLDKGNKAPGDNLIAALQPILTVWARRLLQSTALSAIWLHASPELRRTS